jgi:four helix bundle protein
MTDVRKYGGANSLRWLPLWQMAGDFRRLVAYQRARALAIDLHRATARWSHHDRATIGTQLVRAAYSVAANIAEANGRWHPADRRRCLWIARGSLHETEHWITCAAELGLLEPLTAERVDDIARPLNGLIRRLEP